MQEKKEICPYCGQEKFVIGKQTGYATLKPNKRVSLKEETIYHKICLNCGTVVRSFVNNPKNLLNYKEKNNKNI